VRLRLRMLPGCCCTARELGGHRRWIWPRICCTGVLRGTMHK
jgi:hypothetical protein